MIPPPIVQSTYDSHRKTAIESVALEKPNYFESKQNELEGDLQFLLDAQADGLVRGLEAGPSGDRSSTVSETPTIRSVMAASTGSPRRPVRRQPGLRSARKGIYNRILALSALKVEEIQDIDHQVHKYEQTLNQIESWETKKQGLEDASKHVDSSEDTIRVQRLKQEADSLQVEINKVELQLMEMKTKHRKLLKQAAVVENSVHAKLASYSASLRMLEEDIANFLTITPDNTDLHSTSPNTKSSVWLLPPKRRPLSMAKDYWAEKRSIVLQHRESIEHENSALSEGATVWGDAVAAITDFEKKLRSEMIALSPSSSNSNLAWEQTSSGDATHRMIEILNQMEGLIKTLESKLEYAEERNWTLLIAALGAEMDALRKGGQILQGVISGDESSQMNADTQTETLQLQDAGEKILELDKSFETMRRPPLNRNASATSAASDDPDPELLFSRQDDNE